MISRGLRKHPRLIGLIMERQGREKNNPASCWPWPLPGAAPSKRALISLLVVVCQINGPWRSDRWRPSRLIVPHAWTLSAVLGSLGSPKSRPSLAKCSSPWGTHPDPSKGAGKVRDAPRMGREVCPEDPKTEQRLCLHLAIPGDAWEHHAWPPPFVWAACRAVGKGGQERGLRLID